MMYTQSYSRVQQGETNSRIVSWHVRIYLISLAAAAAAQCEIGVANLFSFNSFNYSVFSSHLIFITQFFLNKKSYW